MIKPIKAILILEVKGLKIYLRKLKEEEYTIIAIDEWERLMEKLEKEKVDER